MTVKQFRLGRGTTPHQANKTSVNLNPQHPLATSSNLRTAPTTSMIPEIFTSNHNDQVTQILGYPSERTALSRRVSWPVSALGCRPNIDVRLYGTSDSEVRSHPFRLITHLVRLGPVKVRYAHCLTSTAQLTSVTYDSGRILGMLQAHPAAQNS